MSDHTADLKTLMEKYEQELLRLKQHAIPVAAPVPAPSPADPITPTTDPLPQSVARTAFFAPLQVRVTAANEAIPIPSALVTISRETESGPILEQIRLTDNSGLTESVMLPATDPALTLQPESESIPLITYEIQISAPGYYRVRNTGIPLYGGIPTVLPVSMIPLPEFEDPDAGELEFDTPRNNL